MQEILIVMSTFLYTFPPVALLPDCGWCEQGRLGPVLEFLQEQLLAELTTSTLNLDKVAITPWHAPVVLRNMGPTPALPERCRINRSYVLDIFDYIFCVLNKSWKSGYQQFKKKKYIYIYIYIYI